MSDLEILLQKSKAGDSSAQFELGLKYYFGDGVPQDYVKVRGKKKMLKKI